MKEGLYSHSKRKGRGQAMVEFVIALPILLFVLFGIIEFARMVFAWMAVQNAARFGIRYAVTGEFNEIYCVEAGNYLGASHVNADTDSGDPQDCLIPDSYPGTDGNDLERDLIDHARLFSIQDAAVGGGAGLWLRPNVSGNYDQYLSNHDEAFIGLPHEEGFYHVTICSNRDNQYAMDRFNYSIPLCIDALTPQLMDDAGGPGDRVKVRIEHQHPLFLPLLSNLWSSVTLTAERDGIVEKFRTSRVIGVSGPILSAPTWTQTPSITPTPTVTPTPTDTFTPTPSLSPTITLTPIPMDCDLITVDHSEAGHMMLGLHGVKITITNNNPVSVYLRNAHQSWVKNVPTRTMNAFTFNASPWFLDFDPIPPTNWNPAPIIEMLPGATGDYISVLLPPLVPLEGNHTADLDFGDGCHKGVTAIMPTSTPSSTPTITLTPTMTPTPDCSQYSMSPFTFINNGRQFLTVTNGDVVDTVANQIQFNWNYAELLGAANGYHAMNVDWFAWNGAYFHLDGQGGASDLNSPTNWIGGSLPFNAGNSYIWTVDFDSDWGGGGPLTGVINNDFGVIIHFANGCMLQRNAIPRSVTTFTPSPTPTTTWTPTPVPPPTSTPLPSATPLPTATPLPSFTPTASWTPSITPTASDTPVATNTPLPTNTPITPTASNTPIPSVTPIPTNTFTPSATSPPTATKTPSPTPIPTWTPACPPDDLGYPCQPTWTATP